MSYQQPPPSPIEIEFWETAKPLIPELQREVWIGKKYRVDFLIPSKKIIIELYGYQHHQTKEKLTHDAERERYLQRFGYQIIRFTGTEVYRDVRKCVNEVLLLAKIQPVTKPVTVPAKAKPPAKGASHGGIIRWSLLILIVVVIACGAFRLFSSNSSNSSSNPIKIQPFGPTISGMSVPGFIIQIEDDTRNDELKKLITNSMQKWQNLTTSPGKSQWRVTFPANESALISLGWCATNRTVLDQNWPDINYSLLIDDRYVDLTAKEWEFQNGNGICRGYTEKQSGWAVGRHTFLWLYNLNETVDNGKDTYEAGEYIIEFSVEVK